MSPGDVNDEGHAGGEVFDARWDPDKETATDAIVRSIAACSGTKPLAMEPLYHAVNTDAIDSLFDRNGSELVVTFAVEEYLIRVESDRIRIREKS